MARILFYGNCQVEALAKYASAYSSSHDLTVLRNYELIADPQKGASAVRRLANIDLVIYQPLDARYGVLSTTDEGIFGILEDADRISLPYVYNDAMWPTFPEGDRFHEEELVAKLISDPTPEVALRKYLLGGVDFRYEEGMEGSLRQLRTNEEMTTVRISDFISGNFADRRLFFTQNHPSSHVFGELIDQLNSLTPGIFPSRRSVDGAGLNFAELPLEWDVDLSAFQQWQYSWCEGSDVLEGTRRFIESWPAIRASRGRRLESSSAPVGGKEAVSA